MRYPPPGRGYPPAGRPPGPSPAFSWAPYIIIGFVLFAVLGFAPLMRYWPVILLVVVVGIPAVRWLLASAARYRDTQRTSDSFTAAGERPEKRKNRTYRAGTSYVQEPEKPKREPEYTVGDDGELVEREAILEADKPKRSQNGRDSFV